MNKNKTMKLELTHLAPYLPYDLKSVDYFDGTQLIRDVTLFNVANFFDQTTNAKPILRPISDLTKEITHNGETFVPMKNILKEVGINYPKECYTQDKDWILNDAFRAIGELPYRKVQHLLEWHFDIFNLIPQGLAIDINTLKS